MEVYKIPNGLKKEIGKATKSNPNKKEVFQGIIKEVFPNIKASALLIGEKLDLVSYE